MIEILVPSPGESITHVVISKWLVENNSFVEKDTDLCEIESEKATLTISNPVDGSVEILVNEGSTVAVGSIIAKVLPLQSALNKAEKNNNHANLHSNESFNTIKISPLAKELIKEKGISIDLLAKKERISKKDVEAYIKFQLNTSNSSDEKGIEIIKMSSLRKKIAERLVSVKNETAMLTTFNEIDMGKLLALRNEHKEKFKEKHGVKLGFISFFAKAVSLAIKEYPIINASIDEDNILLYKNINLSIAVSTDKGLMAPVIMDLESKKIFEIEKALYELASRARSNKITIAELSGGTFTITNGGVFGSLFSTPIINPPQSAILGLHKISDRVVVYENNIAIRPMMYIALSYDHRLIDGKESVGFIIRVKELIETPELLFDMEDIDITKALGLT